LIYPFGCLKLRDEETQNSGIVRVCEIVIVSLSDKLLDGSTKDVDNIPEVGINAHNFKSVGSCVCICSIVSCGVVRSRFIDPISRLPKAGQKFIIPRKCIWTFVDAIGRVESLRKRIVVAKRCIDGLTSTGISYGYTEFPSQALNVWYVTASSYSTYARLS
jgi:hypothetical protein